MNDAVFDLLYAVVYEHKARTGHEPIKDFAKRDTVVPSNNCMICMHICMAFEDLEKEYIESQEEAEDDLL